MFDAWHMPLVAIVMSALSIAIVLACVVLLRRAAEHSRARALNAVDEALLRAQECNAPGRPTPHQLELLRRMIADLNEGAFAPFSQQPMLKAIVVPFATWGGTALLDYMAAASI